MELLKRVKKVLKNVEWQCSADCHHNLPFRHPTKVHSHILPSIFLTNPTMTFFVDAVIVAVPLSLAFCCVQVRLLPCVPFGKQ